MDADARRRVEAFWARVLPGVPRGSGALVVPHGEPLSGYPGVYCLVRGGDVRGSAPQEMVRRGPALAAHARAGDQPRVVSGTAAGLDKSLARAYVGVLTAPGARGQGVGAALAATAARWAVERHGLARWRSLAGNAPSRRLAATLGFEDDGTQLAARPE